LKTLYRFKEAGVEAYLVGGGIRDLLLGVQPKDFDIATAATPEEVKDLFGRQCRLIGRRFRLAHVRFGREIIEVATFRAGHQEAETEGLGERCDESGRILRDNVYGNVEQDAHRRDFTINALYYDVTDFSVRDYVGALEDVAARRLRLIGDPEDRYREDPVRMLRAVRIAAKLDLTIDEATEKPLFALGDLLHEVPPARLFDEVLKMLMAVQGPEVFEQLRRYGLLGKLFEATEEALGRDDSGASLALIRQALAGTAKRIEQDKPVTPAFLFAALLWPPTLMRKNALETDGLPEVEALQRASEEVIRKLLDRVSLPRRFSTPMQDIWHLQRRLFQRRGKRPLRLLEHPRFRAAYDFLLLRAAAGEVEQELADWWTELQEANAERRAEMTATAPGEAGGGQGRRRRRRRKGGQGGQGSQGRRKPAQH